MLLRKNIEAGEVYKCSLSGFRVLVYDVEDHVLEKNKQSHLVMGRYYNPVTGKYEKDSFLDNQLGSIEE